MLYVNDTFRVWYVAKGFDQNLNDVNLLIIKPDSSVEGIFVMENDIFGMGCYYYDYTPSIAGKYLFTIICPSQNAKHISSETFVIKETKKPVVSFSR